MELEVVELFVAHPLPHFGEQGFGGEREVGLHHPIVVGRFGGEDALEGLALVLAEVEDLAVLLVVGNMSHKVGPEGVGGEEAELLDIVDDGLADGAVGSHKVGILVAVELGFEHLVGGEGVGIGTMSVVEVLVAIETVGGLEGALFHFVEDVLHVDKAALFEAEGVAGTEELLDEHGDVEFVGVVARQVGIANEGCHLGGKFAEGGLVGHVGIADAVDGGGYFGNMDCAALGIGGANTADKGLGGVVGVDFVKADFDDVVAADVDASCFEVKKDDRFGKFEFHLFLEVKGLM